LEQGDPTGGGALEDRGLRVDPAELAGHRLAQRAGNAEVLAQRPGWQYRIKQPIAAI